MFPTSGGIQNVVDISFLNKSEKLNSMIFLLFLGFIAGFALGVFFILFASREDSPKPSCKQIIDPQLTPYLEKELKNLGNFKQTETCVALNFMLQFIFQERQYDLGVHQWLTDLLNAEFKQLLKHKTLSKIIHRMEIQNLNLGTNLPSFKTATTSLVDFIEHSSMIDTLHIDLDLDYTGGFEFIVDAVSRISKKAVVKIKVMKIAGKARLQMLRHPFSHWGFSFIEEPEVDFHVESNVLGHHIPKFKSIIINQLKNLIRTKHVLPYYKLRRTPLVGTKEKKNLAEDDVVPGKLTLNIYRFSRLQGSLERSSAWGSIVVTETPVICAYEAMGFIIVVQDIKITKKKEAAIGFLTVDNNLVDWVAPDSPAYEAGLRKGDILLAIGNILLNANQQAGSLVIETQEMLPNSTLSVVTVRVRRTVSEIPKMIQQSVRSQSLTLSSTKLMENKTQDICQTDDDTSLNGVISNNTKDQSINSSSLNDLSNRNSIVDAETLETHMGQGVLDSSQVSGLKLYNERKRGTLVSDLMNSWTSKDTSQSLPGSPKLKRFRSRLSSSKDETNSGRSTPDWTDSPETPRKASTPVSPAREFVEPPKTPQPPKRSTELAKSISSAELKSKFGEPSKYGKESPSDKKTRTVSKTEIKTSIRNFPSKSSTVSKYFQTAIVNGGNSFKMDADIDFELSEDTRYLTVCLWVYPLDCEGNKVDPWSGNPDGQLVGYSSVSVPELIQDTDLNSSRCITKEFHVSPSDPTCKEVMSSLSAHKGFEPTLCYGDMLVTAQFLPVNRLSKVSEQTNYQEEEDLTDNTGSDDEESESIHSTHKEREHNFKKTHFNSSTQCDFCKKKIWFKEANQCSTCRIICHKRCMTRCKQATTCDLGGLRYREIRPPDVNNDQETMPEIVMTSDDNLKIKTESIPTARHNTLGSLFTHVKGSNPSQYLSCGIESLKRSGSATNLAPPHNGDNGVLSKSLPPSPQHSPRQSRKSSLSGNPFLVEDTKLDPHQYVECVLARILAYPNNERMIILAKESAPELFKHLEPKDRLERIEQVSEILQKQLTAEGKKRKDLAIQEKEAIDSDNVLKMRLALQISACDNLTQAIALLTMHFMTAHQLCSQDKKNVSNK